jgi:hypothetical protein
MPSKNYSEGARTSPTLTHEEWSFSRRESSPVGLCCHLSHLFLDQPIEVRILCSHHPEFLSDRGPFYFRVILQQATHNRLVEGSNPSGPTFSLNPRKGIFVICSSLIDRFLQAVDPFGYAARAESQV